MAAISSIKNASSRREVRTIESSWLSKSALLASIVVPTLALCAAVWQISVSREVQREATAKQIWREYLSLSISNPDLAAMEKGKYCALRASKNISDHEKYAYFVGHLLFSGEEIFLSTNRSKGWVATLRNEIAIHTDYLCLERQWEEFADASFQPVVMAALKGCSDRIGCPEVSKQ